LDVTLRFRYTSVDMVKMYICVSGGTMHCIMYGVDISVRRIDDWDKLLIKKVSEYIEDKKIPSVLDIGTGSGAQAIRLAGMGAEVTAIDIVNQWDIYHRVENLPNIHFECVDIREYVEKNYQFKKFTFVAMQRVIHYLPYPDALLVLKILSHMTNKLLFLSVTGATSAIATHYNYLNDAIERRFGNLDETGQQLFDIKAPLCIYSKVEIEGLLERSGWNILKMRVSDFGNIKIIATPCKVRTLSREGIH
jgi:SAM-dependent methyltransferase